MFTWLNKQGVRSDKGFEVQFTGRLSLEYREGGRVATINVESGGTKDGVGIECVWDDAFNRWDDDAPSTMNTEEEKRRLFSNLAAALEFQGLSLKILDRVRDGLTIAQLQRMFPKVQRGE